MMMNSYSYEYPRPAVTADILLFDRDRRRVLLIRRGRPPFEGMWALPGGFMEMNETLEECALRELEEETGISGISLQQFHTFSAVQRDPRHRTVTTVYYGFADSQLIAPQAGDDAAAAAWYPLDSLPPLAFDHKTVFEMLLERFPG
jgi:8-oxo-dGTP diphosphatase